MQNVAIALQLLTTLLTQLQNIGTLIAGAVASGTDITPAQLSGLSGDYQTALTKLNTDIATAQAAGK